MKTLAEIRTDLEHIRDYHSCRGMIGKPSKVIYPPNFTRTLGTYAKAVTQAPEILSGVYCGLYIDARTQKELAVERNVTENHILKLNKRLLLYFSEYFQGNAP